MFISIGFYLENQILFAGKKAEDLDDRNARHLSVIMITIQKEFFSKYCQCLQNDVGIIIMKYIDLMRYFPY